MSSDPTETNRFGFFDPRAEVDFQSGSLPHWRQQGVTYFVTFRLADSLPQSVLADWQREREIWLSFHPDPLSPTDEKEYHERFTTQIQRWLDQGMGSCILRLSDCRCIVENAFRHFDGKRYTLGEYVVASDHVHVIVAPFPSHELSEILHSWKSFTANEILKVDAAVRLLAPFWNGQAVAKSARSVWQKESFDHIVRSAESLARFERYIQNHNLPKCPS